MRNDVLQNYLDQFLKCLAVKFQDASKVVIFRPQNSYILHCQCGLFTLYLKGNLENLDTLGPNAKFLSMGYRGNSWVQMTPI